jgi:hypothetical protein
MSNNMLQKYRLAIAAILLGLYVDGYRAFRLTNSEIRQSDRHAYLMFPYGYAVVLYYLWRPLSYLDGALTGMRFHIGPHRP